MRLLLENLSPGWPARWLIFVQDRSTCWDVGLAAASDDEVWTYQVALSSLVLPASQHDRLYRALRDSDLLIADPGREEVHSAEKAGARVYEGIRFSEVSVNPPLPPAVSQGFSG